MTEPGLPGGRLPIFVKGQDGTWQPLREGAEARASVAAQQRPVRPSKLRPRLCRLALASAIASALGPFTLGLSSLAALALGVLSLRRMRTSDEPVTGKRWAMAGIGGAATWLLVQMFTGPLGMRTTQSGCAAVFQPDFAGRAHATQQVLKLHQAAVKWKQGCPTVSGLVRANLLPRDQDPLDPWGTPYRIVCEPDVIVVVSAGPDRKDDTPDDIRAGK